MLTISFCSGKVTVLQLNILFMYKQDKSKSAKSIKSVKSDKAIQNFLAARLEIIRDIVMKHREANGNRGATEILSRLKDKDMRFGIKKVHFKSDENDNAANIDYSKQSNILSVNEVNRLVVMVD